jgi:hypothetical protein
MSLSVVVRRGGGIHNWVEMYAVQCASMENMLCHSVCYAMLMLCHAHAMPCTCYAMSCGAQL